MWKRQSMRIPLRAQIWKNFWQEISEGSHPAASSITSVWYFGTHTESPSGLRGCKITGCPVGGRSGGHRVPWARHNVWKVLEMLEVHLQPRSGRLALKVIQSGPIRVSRIQILNDLIRAGFQFKKMDRQPNQVLLQLLLLLGRQLTNEQRSQSSLKGKESWKGFHEKLGI